MQVNDTAGFHQAMRAIRNLLSNGNASGAVEFVDECVGHAGHILQLRAYTYTEAGRATDDVPLLESGALRWQELIDDVGPSAGLLFNLANAEEGIVEAVGRNQSLTKAFVEHRERLHRARKLFEIAGADETANDETRVTSWTNCGNAYDYFGRSFEALQSYAGATAIDSSFGMALGNRGQTLLRYAPLVHDHQPMILRQAAEALDGALADEERVVRIGGPAALEHFRSERKKISSGAPSHEHEKVRWTDPYLRWCSFNELFLHVSPDCVTSESGVVDPLFFHSVLERPDQESQERVTILIDAFNAIKQDYLSTRYLAWLATGVESPIKEKASELSKQAVFWDSANYSRWGLTTGMAGQALANAINVLDKVASFVHLYIGTSRKSTGVYFSSLWHKRGSDKIDSEIEAEIEAGNMALLALCDLSCDHDERDTPLKEFVKHRHAATHRFLVMHDMGGADTAPTGEWLQRTSWSDLPRWLEEQLRTTRAALIYLARTIDTREGRMLAAAKEEGKLVPPLPITHAITEHPSF